MASPVQISVNQLSRLVGTPGAPVIIDARNGEDFNDDPRLIPAAIRCEFPSVIDKIDSVVDTIGARHAVVYCQKGLKISEGVAALLRSRSVSAEVLEGGQFGWRDAGMLMAKEAHGNNVQRNANGQSVWVTRTRPKVDRIACAWLIRRFIDPNATFMFVTGSQVALVAEKFHATPFDVEDVLFSHRDSGCTFDTMLQVFGLQGECKTAEALNRLATVVRGADTDRLDLAPQCAGLMAISLGLSRQYSDDLEQLEAGMHLYDAMYRWARDAFNEKHEWSSAGHTAGGSPDGK